MESRHHVDGCQWPLFGYPKYEVPYYSKDPKREHTFDNQPCDQV